MRYSKSGDGKPPPKIDEMPIINPKQDLQNINALNECSDIDRNLF